MLGDLVNEIFTFITGLIREVFTLIVEFFRQPEGWLILVLLTGGFGAIVTLLFPTIDFLGIPGVHTFSDVASQGYLGYILFGALYYSFMGLLLWLFPAWWAVILLFAFPWFWWVWIFFIFFPIFEGLWIHLHQEYFKQDIKWVTLELRMPRLVAQLPQAMEQVLTAMHGLRNSPGNVREIYVDGEITRWFVLEMVSFGGDIRFYLRCRDKQKNIIEAAFFSYYSDVEIVEVEDYVEKLPKTVGELYAQNKNIFGAEIILGRDEVYPIKTYPMFETPDPERRLDPISAFLEVMGKLKDGEFLGIQLVLSPADKEWYKDWTDFLKNLKDPNAKKKEKDPEAKLQLLVRSPGETETLKAVENNLSKPAFDTIIRFLYVAPNELYSDDFARRGVLGAFNQYGTLDLNNFKASSGMTTRTDPFDWPHVLLKPRAEYRRQRILDLYRKRSLPPEQYWGKWYTSYLLNSGFHSKTFRLNTEAVATLFHPPTEFVLTAPHIKRVESRKAGPPAGLAIFGEEEVIEKYYPKK